LRRALKNQPGFTGLVVGAFVWNFAFQFAGPFFNVYLVSELHASLLMVGLVTGISSLFDLVGTFFWPPGRPERARWVMVISGLVIPIFPLAWVFITQPWQVGFINAGAGYFGPVITWLILTCCLN